MQLNEYQAEAHKTEKKVYAEGADNVVPILGLAGEVGELLNEYKKRLRDGSAHLRFGDRVAEELGDILWYVAATATKFGLDLEDVAGRNLAKTRARWGAAFGEEGGGSLPGPKARAFDARFLEGERFPRQFVADFRQWVEGGTVMTKVFVGGTQMGETH